MLARDHQGRQGDPGQVAGEIRIADCGTAGDVASRRAAQHHIAPALVVGRVRRLEVGGHPTGHDRIGNGSHTPLVDLGDALVPHRGGTDDRTGVHSTIRSNRSG